MLLNIVVFFVSVEMLTDKNIFNATVVAMILKFNTFSSETETQITDEE